MEKGNGSRATLGSHRLEGYNHDISLGDRSRLPSPQGRDRDIPQTATHTLTGTQATTMATTDRTWALLTNLSAPERYWVPTPWLACCARAAARLAP